MTETKQQNGHGKVDASGDHKSRENGTGGENGAKNGVHENGSKNGVHENGSKNGVHEKESNGYLSKSDEESDGKMDEKVPGAEKNGNDEKKKEIASALFGVSNLVEVART